MADTINSQLYDLLKLPGSFDFPFNQLNKLGKITSSDSKIRIFTWNLPSSDGANSYFGFLQYRQDGKHDITLVKLTDHRAEIADPGESTLTPDHWYGMLVYEIVETEINNMIYYTLLGFENRDLFLSCKIADVLYFNDDHEPMFGKALFHYHNKYLCRILFWYSARVQMSLHWNDKLNMIVFDHLSPANESYTGNYQYYGPDLSFDALRFENGIWELKENIDVRNSNDR